MIRVLLLLSLIVGVLGIHVPNLVCDQVHAQSHVAKRLAILAVQAEQLPIEQLQVWSNYIRKQALTIVDRQVIWVLDQSQMQVLLAPKTQLESCVDDCEVQLARKIGAHWVLSTYLKEMKASSELYITMKLHDVRGFVLSIAQEKIQDRSKILTLFTQMTIDVLQPLLAKTSPHFKASTPDTSTTRTNPNDNHSHSSARQSASQSNQKSQSHSSSVSSSHSTTGWTEIYWKQKLVLCLSDPIHSADYKRCVQQKQCDKPVSWGNCVGEKSQAQAMNCLNLKQAVQVSHWLQARLIDKYEIEWLKENHSSYWKQAHQARHTLSTWVWDSGMDLPAIWQQQEYTQPTHTRTRTRKRKRKGSFAKTLRHRRQKKRQESLYKKVRLTDAQMQEQQSSLLIVNTVDLKSHPKGLVFNPKSQYIQLFPAAFQAAHLGVRAVRLPINDRCDFL